MIPAALVIAGLVPGLAQAQKVDVLTLPNGDRVTGEIKGMSRGKLDYLTDDAGRLSIEWEKVARLTSPFRFDIMVRSGRRYFGRLARASEDGALVVSGVTADTLRVTDVVEITPLGAQFLQRVKAYLDVGFSLAKANAATTLTVDGEMEYHGPKVGTTLSFDSYVQGQESSATTTRNSVNLQVSRFLPNRWEAGGVLGFEQNDELNLALRVTGGGGVGRVIRHSNRGELGALAGLVVTQERFTLDSATAGGSADTASTNLEAMFGFSAQAYRFDSPKLDLGAGLTLFPSLSSFGRVRGELTLRLKYELLKDFHVGVNFTDTFDSRPPDPDASNNDFVTSLTIGWSYRR